MAGTSTIEARKRELIEELNLLPPGEERLLQLLNIGRKYPAMDDALKTDDRLLPGCVSRLWIQEELVDGHLVFHMDADAAISKGIAAAVLGLYNHQPPDAILAVEPDFFAQTGLDGLISPNRSNAVASLRKFLATTARKYLPDGR